MIIYIHMYIYMYIKWTVIVNVTTKSAQHAHARMIAIIVEKSPNSSHMYDHGFMDNTNRQAACKSQKNPLSDSQTAEELQIPIVRQSVLSMKPWSYIWLEFGLFSTIIYVYIYIYICVYIYESLAPGGHCLIWISNFQSHVKDSFLKHFPWYCPEVNTTRHHQWFVFMCLYV